MELLSVGPPGLDSSGYGEMQRRILLALENLGWSIAMRPFASLNETILDEINQERLANMEKRPLPPAGSPKLFFGPPPVFYANKNFYTIGFTMSELDRISKDWVDKCNSLNEIWVPSRFNYQTFASSGVLPDKLHIVPLGVDTWHFRPAEVKKEKERFVFLSCFELIPRKNCDLLIEAFYEEFSTGEPVELVIKAFENWGRYDPRGSRIADILQSIQKKCPGSASVTLKTELVPYSELPSLYREADCYISASRGEGWNLPAMEAMACGIPAIAFNWSGHTEFLSHANGFLVDIPGLEEIPDGYNKGARWVKADKDSLRKTMRYVVEHPSEVIAKGNQARLDIVSKYSIEIVARKITSRLKKRGEIREKKRRWL